MKTRNDVFQECCRREFSFLAGFGFSLVSSVKDNYGCSLKYKNNWAAVDVRLDLQGPGMVIDCYKLKDGEIPGYPVFFGPNQEFLVFDLNDLLLVRMGKSIEQNARLMYEEGYMRAKIREFAASLKAHAADILSGDFSVLPEIRKRVVRRAKELEDEQ